MEQTLTQPAVHEPLLAYPTLTESWAALGWFLLLLIGLILVVILPAEAIFHEAELPKLALRLSLAVATNVLLVLWLRRRAGTERWLGLRWRGPRRPWVAFGLLLVVVPALAVVLSAQWFLRLPHWGVGKSLAALGAHPMLALVVGCVAAPATEEVLFRGALLPGLLRNYRPAVAIGQSALLFGIFHFNPAQSLNAFLIGLLLGWVYYRSRSLWLCIGLHGLYNALAFWANRLPWLADAQHLPPFMRQPTYALLWLAAALVLAGCLWVLARSQAAPASLA